MCRTQGHSKTDGRNPESSHPPVSAHLSLESSIPLSRLGADESSHHQSASVALLSEIGHLLGVARTIPFRKRSQCCMLGPRAQRSHRAADFPTVTHLQSASLTGVCSHLISAHTLCLSLPPRGDGTPSAKGHARARTRRHAVAS